jgi:beta-glucosidase
VDNTSARAERRALVARLTLERKCALLTGRDFWSLRALPEIGLWPITLSDGPVGVRGPAWESSEPSALLPNPGSIAATWDEALAADLGELVGSQAQEKGVHVLLGPTLNLQRSPFGGRNFECFSEDPLLTARMGAAYVRGVQSRGVAATLKHYVGNETEQDRMSYDSLIDERALREVYLQPFEACIRAGAWALMAAYNRVNGVSMTEHNVLLGQLLRDEWEFDGVVVSDWTAARSTVETALAGLDVVMPGPVGPWGTALVDAVTSGQVPESLIDSKVEAILLLAERVGTLRLSSTGSLPLPRMPGPPADTRRRLRAAAARGMVLLTNTGVLPLNAQAIRRLALIGPNAVAISAQGGGSAAVTPSHVVSPVEGLRSALAPETSIVVRVGVHTNRLLRVLGPDVGIDPVSGSPGTRVDVQRADGSTLETFSQATARVVIAGTDEYSVTDVARIVLDATLRAPAGLYELDVWGSGHVDVQCGDVGYSADLPPAADVIEGMVRPGFHRMTVPFAGNAEVPLHVSFAPYEGSRVISVGIGFDRVGPGEEDLLADAVAAASEADVAVVIVGTSAETESEGFDRTSLRLPGRQDELVSRVAAVNAQTIVVVNAGGPVLMPWAGEVAAILWAWLPGQEAGDALADVLTGAVEPQGRLPMTLPIADDGPAVIGAPAIGNAHEYGGPDSVGYRLYQLVNAQPAFPFGYGLGYSAWAYDSMSVERLDGGIRVRVDLRNTGGRESREVVQCYAQDGDVGHRLVGFAAASAQAGEATTVFIDLDERTLSRWNVAENSWRAPASFLRLLVGPSAMNTPLSADAGRGDVLSTHQR